MNPLQQDFLMEAAGRYVWWQAPEEALARHQRVWARVMDLGGWEDWVRLVELFSREALADVLSCAEIRQFRPRSWSFWHCRLNGEGEVAPMPRRVVP